MQIFTQHAAVGLQTKFEANRTANGILRPWDPPEPARQAKGYSKFQNIDADSYSAYCSRVTNQILNKSDNKLRFLASGPADPPGPT